MDYFRDLKERENVKIFVTDMYKPYAELTKIYFRNAKIVTDKYHYYRQINRAKKRVRVRIQKAQRPHGRKLLKGNRRLLSKTSSSLKTEEWLALERILMLNEELYMAWLLKEEFLLIRNCKNSDKGRSFLTKWLELARSFNLREFSCTPTFGIKPKTRKATSSRFACFVFGTNAAVPMWFARRAFVGDCSQTAIEKKIIYPRSVGGCPSHRRLHIVAPQNGFTSSIARRCDNMFYAKA